MAIGHSENGTHVAGDDVVASAGSLKVGWKMREYLPGS